MFSIGPVGGVIALVVLLMLLALLGVVAVAAATRTRRRMRRHPAPTFVFADLVGYTALTERQGDAAAADVARRFERAMCQLSREHGAWQVKAMGDGVMIWCPSPSEAVALASRAVGEVGARADLLPVRAGVHTGPAVMRGCDWYGTAVNVAARLAAEAGAGEALVSDATREFARRDRPTFERGADLRRDCATLERGDDARRDRATRERPQGDLPRRELSLRGLEDPIWVSRIA